MSVSGNQMHPHVVSANLFKEDFCSYCGRWRVWACLLGLPSPSRSSWSRRRKVCLYHTESRGSRRPQKVTSRTRMSIQLCWLQQVGLEPTSWPWDPRNVRAVLGVRWNSNRGAGPSCRVFKGTNKKLLSLALVFLVIDRQYFSNIRWQLS